MTAMRSFIFILLAALFLGSAAYLGNKYLFDPVEPTAPVPSPVAHIPEKWALRLVKDVSRGDILAKGLVEWQRLPQGEEEGHLLTRENTDLALWQGAAFTRSLTKDSYVQDVHLVQPSDADYLKTLLADGMRARPVAVHNRRDFEQLRPGDHVDLILTYITPTHAARAGETVVKTLLENILVIGVEADTVKEGGRGNTQENSLTLALSPDEVELVSMAEAIGKLRISLHGGPWAENLQLPSPKVAFSASDLFPDLKPASKVTVRDQSRVIRVMRGGETSVVTLSPLTGK